MVKTLSLGLKSDNTALKRPKELFSFSRKPDGLWQSDEQESKLEDLAYFYLPDALVDSQYDLSGGIKNFKLISDEDNVANFPAYLDAIVKHEQKQGKKTKADIITFRGIMTKILLLPYKLDEGVHLQILTYDGQIFIRNDDERLLKERAADKQKLQSNPTKAKHMETCEYAGYKFETLATLPKPWAECTRTMIENRHKKVVSNYGQYISVVLSGMGKVRTLLAGEVDCVWDYVPEGKGDVLPHYVELKTSRKIDTPQQAQQFEKKLFRTWAQCFLLGIQRIVYGFRDDNYILRNVEVYNTGEPPVFFKNEALPRGSSPPVNCMAALQWYGAALNWIVENVDTSSERAYRLDYEPGSGGFVLTESDEGPKWRDGVILSEAFMLWRETLATAS